VVSKKILNLKKRGKEVLYGKQQENNIFD